MNIFVPYLTTDKIALSFKEDKKRFNAQLNEAKGILKTLRGEANLRHPIVDSFRGNEDFLEAYIASFEAVKNEEEFIPSTPLPSTHQLKPLIAIHRKNLYTKNPVAFKQFKDYNVLPEGYSLYRINDAWQFVILKKKIDLPQSTFLLFNILEILIKNNLNPFIK